MSHEPDNGQRFVLSAYQRYGGELRRYLSRRLHNESDARELAQEVWTRLLRVTNTAEIMEPLAYIYRTASNVIVEFKMRKQRERVSFDTEKSEHFAEHPLETPQADELVERMSRERELERALVQLPKTYRSVLILKLTQDLSYEEIGRQLGFSARTVEQYFFRAMAQVKKARSKT